MFKELPKGHSCRHSENIRTKIESCLVKNEHSETQKGGMIKWKRAHQVGGEKSSKVGECHMMWSFSSLSREDKGKKSSHTYGRSYMSLIITQSAHNSHICKRREKGNSHSIWLQLPIAEILKRVIYNFIQLNSLDILIPREISQSDQDSNSLMISTMLKGMVLLWSVWLWSNASLNLGTYTSRVSSNLGTCIKGLPRQAYSKTRAVVYGGALL